MANGLEGRIAKLEQQAAPAGKLIFARQLYDDADDAPERDEYVIEGADDGKVYSEAELEAMCSGPADMLVLVSYQRERREAL